MRTGRDRLSRRGSVTIGGCEVAAIRGVPRVGVTGGVEADTAGIGGVGGRLTWSAATSPAPVTVAASSAATTIRPRARDTCST